MMMMMMMMMIMMMMMMMMMMMHCFCGMADLTKDVICRSSPPDVFLGKGSLQIHSKFIEEHPCRSMASIKLLCSFIEITLWRRCSPVNLLHTFRTPFYKNTYRGLLLQILFPGVYIVRGSHHPPPPKYHQWNLNRDRTSS